MVETAKKTTTKDPAFLQTYSSVRPYVHSQLDQLFQDMRSEWSDNFDPGVFEEAALSIGTHAPKLAQARIAMRAMMIKPQNSNKPGKVAGSGNGANAKYMKVLLRPIAISGRAGEACLFKRYHDGSKTTQDLLKAFENVFGSAARAALAKGMTRRMNKPVPLVYGENFPIFFLPGDGGGDLQASPGGSIEAITNMQNICYKMRMQAKADRAAERPFAYGDWSELSFSDKPQNMIVGAPIVRTRFRTRFPQILMRMSAEIYRFKKDGAFPQLRDNDVADAMIDYTRTVLRLEDVKEYRGSSVTDAQDDRAAFIVRRAREFIEEVAAECGDDIERLEMPSVAQVISRVSVGWRIKSREHMPGNLTAQSVKQVMKSRHFRDAIEKFGKVEV